MTKHKNMKIIVIYNEKRFIIFQVEQKQKYIQLYIS